MQFYGFLLVWTVVSVSVLGAEDPVTERTVTTLLRVPVRQGLPPRAPAVDSPRRAARRPRAVRGVSFVGMVDNLRGKSGQGYYIEMAVGTPPQKVSKGPWSCPKQHTCLNSALDIKHTTTKTWTSQTSDVPFIQPTHAGANTLNT